MPEVSWNDHEFGVDTPFHKLEKGENKFRILSKNPFITKVYWVRPDPNGPANRVVAPDDPSEDLLAQAGHSPRTRYAVVALSRRDGSVAILESGSQVFKQLSSLAKDTEWGDPRTYDVNIKKEGSGLNTEYTVIPQGKKEITDAEKTQIKNAWLDVKDFYKPTPQDEVRALLQQMGESPVGPASEASSDWSDDSSQENSSSKEEEAAPVSASGDADNDQDIDDFLDELDGG